MRPIAHGTGTPTSTITAATMAPAVAAAVTARPGGEGRPSGTRRTSSRIMPSVRESAGPGTKVGATSTVMRVGRVRASVGSTMRTSCHCGPIGAVASVVPSTPMVAVGSGRPGPRPALARRLSVHGRDRSRPSKISVTRPSVHANDRPPPASNSVGCRPRATAGAGVLSSVATKPGRDT